MIDFFIFERLSFCTIFIHEYGDLIQGTGTAHCSIDRTHVLSMYVDFVCFFDQVRHPCIESSPEGAHAMLREHQLK